MEFKNLMVDIESMGNESFSSILSIGALEFDLETGKTGKEFYVEVDLQSCIDLGLVINPSTVIWWMKQSGEARKFVTESKGLPILEALDMFSDFCTGEYEVWGNSPRFDLGIIQNAYNKANLPIPWDFRKERCVRTLVSFNPEVRKNFKFEGVAHHALVDCYNQVKYCCETWKTIRE